MLAFLRSRHTALLALVAAASAGCGEAEPFRAPAITAHTYVRSGTIDEPVTDECLFFAGADGWGAGGNLESATPERHEDLLWLRSHVVGERMDVVAFTGPAPGGSRGPDLPLPGDADTTVLAERSCDLEFAMNREHDEFEFDHRERHWVVKLDGVGETTSCF